MLLHADSHQLLPWRVSSSPQSSSSVHVSERCDLTWCHERQAESDVVQLLLDQFRGLTLPIACLRRARQAEIARIAVSAAHDCLLLSMFNAKDILCKANRFLL